MRACLVLLAVQLLLLSAQMTAAATPPGQSSPGQIENRDAKRPGIEGNWEGSLNSTAGKLRLILKISKVGDAFKATMDSPNQGASDLKVDTFTLDDSYVHFVMNDIEASFDGGLSRDGTEISGQFFQGLASPLVLRRAATGIASPALGFSRGRLTLTPCGFSSLTKDAGCAKYEVFEDRAAKTGRKIALNIVIVPALSAKPAPDPIFVLAGGPGQGAASVVKAAGDYLIKLRRERDIVFIDQRGTGESNPLNCNFVANKDEMRGYFIDGMTVENLRECRALLEKLANLELYTTPIAVDDFDEVRAALGYDKINLHGGSYGTFSGLVYIRQHGDRVRTAMLEGVTPVDAKIYLPFAKGVEHSLERMFGDCAADKECNASLPNLRTEFKELTGKLDKQPAAFEATNPFNGKRESITMSRESFAEQIRTMLYIPIYWRWLPLLIHEANRNNFGPFATIAYANVRSISDQIARGMQLSVVCAEDVPFMSEEEIKRETSGTFYGDHRVRTIIKACEQWPKGKVARSFSEPVKSDVPILMITG
ncbi:MAG TPA: alpha/beta hydrolase, partial [Blastocatellia bacterium]|nr:alpha/beta hydrolase [Blastocatellia bacterium]